MTWPSRRTLSDRSISVWCPTWASTGSPECFGWKHASTGRPGKRPGEYMFDPTVDFSTARDSRRRRNDGQAKRESAPTAPHIGSGPARHGVHHGPRIGRGPGGRRGSRGRRRPLRDRPLHRRALRGRGCGRRSDGERRSPRGDDGGGGARRGAGPPGHRRARDRAGLVGGGRAHRRGSTVRRGGRAGPRVPGGAGEHPAEPRRGADRRAAGRHHRSRPGGRHGGLLPRPVPGPEGRGPRDDRRGGATAPGHRLGPRGPGRPDPARADQDRRRGGHGEDPAGVPAPSSAGVDPQGARATGLGRRGSGRLPFQARRTRAARGRAQGGRARDRQAGTDERTESRARVDPHLAGHGVRAALGRGLRGPARCGRGVAHPRRGPRRPPGREGPHPRAPGRPQAAGRARAGAGVGTGSGRHPGPGRAAGGGQDLPRRVGGPGPRTVVRPGGPGRGP